MTPSVLARLKPAYDVAANLAGRWSTLLRIVGTLSLGVLIWASVDFGRLVDAISGAAPLGILLALGLAPLNLTLENLKWVRLLRAAGAQSSFRGGLASVLCGYAFGIVTPARLGELLGRALKTPSLGTARVSGLTIVDRLLSQVWYLLGGVLALFVLAPGGVGRTITVLAAVVGTAAALLLYAVIRAPAAVLDRLGSVGQSGWADRLTGFLQEAVRDDASRLLTLSGLRYLVIATQFWLVLLALGPLADPAQLLAGGVVILFIKTCVPPVTIGDLGVREAAAVLLAGSMGLTEEASLAAALCLYTINVLWPAVLGVGVFLFHSRPSFGPALAEQNG